MLVLMCEYGGCTQTPHTDQKGGLFGGQVGSQPCEHCSSAHRPILLLLLVS